MLVHTVDTLDIVKSATGVDNVSSVRNILCEYLGTDTAVAPYPKSEPHDREVSHATIAFLYSGEADTASASL